MIFGILILYMVAVAWGLPRCLRGMSWTSRTPRLAVATWLAGTVSVVSMAVLTGALLVVPLHAIGDIVVLLVQWCGWTEHAFPVLPPWTAPRLVGLGLVGLGLLRLVQVGVAVTRARWADQARHRHDVRLLGRFHPRLGIYVLDHTRRGAFCLPGKGGTVVVTRGALRVLQPAELDAVIAHERAHLTGRHHLILTAAAVLARAFPTVPLFAVGHEELRRLVELAADDSAARRSTPRVVAQAVLRLAAPPSPLLGMANTAVHQRVIRLMADRPPPSRSTVLGRVLLVGLLLALPLLVTTIPALSDLTDHCA